VDDERTLDGGRAGFSNGGLKETICDRFCCKTAFSPLLNRRVCKGARAWLPVRRRPRSASFSSGAGLPLTPSRRAADPGKLSFCASRAALRWGWAGGRSNIITAFLFAGGCGMVTRRQDFQRVTLSACHFPSSPFAAAPVAARVARTARRLLAALALRGTGRRAPEHTTAGLCLHLRHLSARCLLPAAIFCLLLAALPLPPPNLAHLHPQLSC